MHATDLSLLVACLWSFLALHPGQWYVQAAGASDEDKGPILPPRPADQPYPYMLHERDVIHYVDTNKEFTEVGSGTFGHVTLGEMRESGFPVVIKRFKDSSFRDILHEIRVHRYVEHLGFSPRFIGLLPTGPLSCNFSLVLEYVHGSKTLLDWFQTMDSLTAMDWLQAFLDLAVNLHRLHQHGVLFNDLHKKNILVQKHEGQKVKTYIIDYGKATYLKGKLYRNGKESLEGYGYLAPELVNHACTSEASDTYAFGYSMTQIADHLQDRNLKSLAHWCTADDPRDRPNLTEVISKLCGTIKFVQEFFGFSVQDLELRQALYLNEEIIKDNERELFQVTSATNTSKATTIADTSKVTNPNIDKDAQSKSGTLLSILFKEEKNRPSDESVWPTLVHSSEDIQCIARFPIFTSRDFVKAEKTFLTGYTHGKSNAIRLAKLKASNETVIVKEFLDVDFNDIRYEACITGYLANRGVAPKIIGLNIDYRQLRDADFLQEYFGQGVTLWSFIRFSRGLEWDLKRLKNVAEGGKFENFKKVEATCHVNLRRIWLRLIVDINHPICMEKSYRQRILEYVSLLVLTHLQTVHESGLLVNNLRSINTVVKWNETGELIGPFLDLRLIDLSVMTSLKKGLRYTPVPIIQNTYNYLAPEVVIGQKSSVESDIYSACVMVHASMEDYFSAMDVSAEYQRYRSAQNQERSPMQPLRTLNDQSVPNNFSLYQHLQKLLHKCLHISYGMRPSLKTLIHILQDINSHNWDLNWI